MSGVTSGASSGSTRDRPRNYRVIGVPKRCWCGAQIVALMSKSDSNPCRRYFRCGFTASKKLINDSHLFKWIDEALLDEIEASECRIRRLEQEGEELKLEHMRFENLFTEKVQKQIEQETMARVEAMIFEAKKWKENDDCHCRRMFDHPSLY